MLYAAYGSNLNFDQMSLRCPDAEFVGTGVIENHQLIFRGVADIEETYGSKTQVGLWKITERCLKALDRYEGYPNLYTRFKIPVKVQGGVMSAIVYQMQATGYDYPSPYYYEAIREGYLDCGLDLYHLKFARHFTHDMIVNGDDFEGVQRIFPKSKKQSTSVVQATDSSWQ